MTSVKGWFSDTLNDETKERILTNVTSKKAALAYIDCDLFEPVIAALDFLTDLLVDGSVIIFDDWFFLRAHPNRGERRAFVEWQRKNPQFTVTEYAKFGWHGCAFIINTK
jgi:hypothetical protein